MKFSGSATVYGIPRSHTHCQLSNYDWTARAGIREALAGFLEKIRADRAPRPPHVLMTGPPGTGKTHLGVGLYRWAVLETGDLSRCCWLHVPSFCDKVKATFGTEDEDPFAQVTNARSMLILDDIFGRELTEFEVNNILARVIDIAYMNGAALVLTTNLTVDQLEGVLQPHEMSRILDGAEVWQFKGEDQRLEPDD